MGVVGYGVEICVCYGVGVGVLVRQRMEGRLGQAGDNVVPLDHGDIAEEFGCMDAFIRALLKSEALLVEFNQIAFQDVRMERLLC